MIIDENNELKIKYVPLSELVLWDENPKQHDIEKLWQSIKQYGFQIPIKYSEVLGGVAAGNGRLTVLRLMQQAGEEVPKGIGVDENNNWYVATILGNDFSNEAQAISFGLDENMIGIMGADGITHLEASRMYDQQAYLDLLGKSIKHSVTADEDDLALLQKLLSEPDDEEEDLPPPEKKDNKPSFTLVFSSKFNQQKFLEYVTSNQDEFFGDYILDLLESN